MASVFASLPLPDDLFAESTSLAPPPTPRAPRRHLVAAAPSAPSVALDESGPPLAPDFLLEALEPPRGGAGLARAARKTTLLTEVPKASRHAQIRKVRMRTPPNLPSFLGVLSPLWPAPPLPIALRLPVVSRLFGLDEAAFSRQMIRFAATPVEVTWARGVPSLAAYLHPMHSTLFSRRQVVSGDVALCLYLLGTGDNALACRILLNEPTRVMNQLRTRVPCLCSLVTLKQALPRLVPLIVHPHPHSYREPAVAATLMVQAYLKLQAREDPRELEILLVELLGQEVLGFCQTPPETGALLGIIVAGFFRYVQALAARDQKRRARLAMGVNILLSLNGLPFQTTATAIVATVVTVALEAMSARGGDAMTAQAQLMAIKGDLKLHIAAHGIGGQEDATAEARQHQALLCNQTLDAVIDANGLS